MKEPYDMTNDELQALPEVTEEMQRRCVWLIDTKEAKALHSWQDHTGRWQPVHDGSKPRVWHKLQLLF